MSIEIEMAGAAREFSKDGLVAIEQGRSGGAVAFFQGLVKANKVALTCPRHTCRGELKTVVLANGWKKHVCQKCHKEARR